MKTLKFLALAITFAIIGINVSVEAKFKKNCSGQANINCNGSCQWRHGKCRDKVKKVQSNNNLSQALANDAVPQGSPIITNNTNTPPNAAAITFYDNNENAITLPTVIWFNGQYVMIPVNAAFVDISYTASNANHDIIQVLDMQSIDPTSNYSLTNPNSGAQPDDSPAEWILTAPAQQTTVAMQFQPFNPATQLADSGFVGQAYSATTPIDALSSLINIFDYPVDYNFFASKNSTSQSLGSGNLTPSSATNIPTGVGYIKIDQPSSTHYFENVGSTHLTVASGYLDHVIPTNTQYVIACKDGLTPSAIFFIGTSDECITAGVCQEGATLFTPAGKFKNLALEGRYISHNQTATMVNLSFPQNQTPNPTPIYSFKNVVIITGTKAHAPAGLTLIGTRTLQPDSGAVTTQTLYGELIPNGKVVAQ